MGESLTAAQRCPRSARAAMAAHGPCGPPLTAIDAAFTFALAVGCGSAGKVNGRVGVAGPGKEVSSSSRVSPPWPVQQAVMQATTGNRPQTAASGDRATGVQQLDEPASAIVSAWSMAVYRLPLITGVPRMQTRTAVGSRVRVQVGPAWNGSGGVDSTEQCWLRPRRRRRRPMARAEAASWWRWGPWTTWMAAPGMAPSAPRRRAARDCANNATGDAAGQMAVAGPVNNRVPRRRWPRPRPRRALDLEAWCTLAALAAEGAARREPSVATARLEAVGALQLASPLPSA
ncbi:hypothetical protein SVAN01_01199 [Stagonosporopsis vannaccii]|nr:hypothetical protein SVAN01_01199 [Stagonosporopsis vannaccii]